jgi:outer membrane lipoprotein-sorting protein
MLGRKIAVSGWLRSKFFRRELLALQIRLNIRGRAVSDSCPFHMERCCLISLIFAALVTPAIFAQDTNQPTVDQLVAKNVEAKGGATALRNLRSLRLTGKMLVQQGQIEYGYVQIKKRPDEVRIEASQQGMTGIAAYDGKEGWRVSPFAGRKDPERMSADDVKALIEDAEIDGALVDWKAKGSTVEYLGTEDVEGTPAHKLRVVRKNGDVSFVYLDPDHFLEIRIMTGRMRHGAYEEVETDLGDYEKAGGVFVPTSIESGPKGDADKKRIIIDKVEANVPVDDTIFHFPASK